MNGPEHYRTAETLLTNSQAFIGADPAAGRIHTPERRAEIIAMAQVHATLAQAAAAALTAMTAPTTYPQPVAQFGDDTSTVDALNDWHQTITIEGEADQ